MGGRRVWLLKLVGGEAGGGGAAVGKDDYLVQISYGWSRVL